MMPKLLLSDKIPKSWKREPISVKISPKRKIPEAGRKSMEKNDPAIAQNQSKDLSEVASGFFRKRKRITVTLFVTKKIKALGLWVMRKYERNVQAKYTHRTATKKFITCGLFFI
jgi:hypothetical protein